MAKKKSKKRVKNAPASPKREQKREVSPFWLSFSAILAVITLVIIFQEPSADVDFAMERDLTLLELEDEENIVGYATSPCMFYKKKVELYKGHRDRYCGLAEQNKRYDRFCLRYNEALQQYKLLSQKHCTELTCIEGTYALAEGGEAVKQCFNNQLKDVRCG